ncbi:hypothetical protein ACFQZ8_04605 [Micromonospora azadirachtae]|uniref:Uncharacterized protein n=1 Tax=Micromonospora azadirachtae TaxID=1970735 RepID=A0ABW2ZX19_9ACTN
MACYGLAAHAAVEPEVAVIRSHVSSSAALPGPRHTSWLALPDGAVSRLDVDDLGPERDGGQRGRFLVGE